MYSNLPIRDHEERNEKLLHSEGLVLPGELPFLPCFEDSRSTDPFEKGKYVKQFSFWLMSHIEWLNPGRQLQIEYLHDNVLNKFFMYREEVQTESRARKQPQTWK